MARLTRLYLAKKPSRTSALDARRDLAIRHRVYIAYLVT